MGKIANLMKGFKGKDPMQSMYAMSMGSSATAQIIQPKPIQYVSKTGDIYKDRIISSINKNKYDKR